MTIEKKSRDLEQIPGLQTSMQLLAVKSVGHLTQSSRWDRRALNFILCARERLNIENDMFIMQ